MENFAAVYTESLRSARKDARTKLNSVEKCYNSLSNKDSEYARAVKGILDLRKATMKIWEDAPEAI